MKKCQEQVLIQETAVHVVEDASTTQAQVGRSTFTKRKLEKRKNHPTSLSADNSEEFGSPSAKRSCQRRRKETLEMCGEIHAGSSKSKGPALDGLWLTLVKQATPATLVNYVGKSRKMKTKVIGKIVKEDIAIFEESTANKLRSLKVLYSKGLMSKEKYKSVRLSLSTMSSTGNCKRTGLKFMPNAPVPKLLPYAKLIDYVNSINIGNVHDFCADFCYNLDDDEKANGAYRDVEEFLVELADMYICLENSNTLELVNFEEPNHFRIAIGADGAPFGKDDEATAWLLSFLNSGERIASVNENFILCGANCSESHPAMLRYAEKLISDLTSIEKSTYILPGSKTKVKFSVELVPSDMKWVSTFSGELSNAAHYFSPFGNVSEDDKCIVNGSLGPGDDCTWKPWVYAERLAVASKVNAKKEELAQSKLAESTKRTKLLAYIKSLKSRQEFVPYLQQLVDKVYAEPLHCANNAWQQLHEIMLSHANDKSGLPSTFTDPSKLPECPLASHLATLKEIRASRLYKKVRKWISQGRKGSLSYRFTGKETKLLSQKFMCLVKAISSQQDTPLQCLMVNTFAFVGLQLRNATSRFTRICIDATVLQELKNSCRNYFNACSILLDKVTPTVWTVGYAIPFHAELLFKKFGFGLGINSMQGREAKHIRISQFSKHATLTTRWTSVLKHDYVTSVWLRKQDPSTVEYHKCKEIYEPKETNAHGFCCCGQQTKPGSHKCELCSSDIFSAIERTATSGRLDPEISCILSLFAPEND